MKTSDLQSKYLFALLAIGGITIYLFSTEIWDRYSSLYSLYKESNILRSQLDDIGNFESRKFELEQTKKTYTIEFDKLYKNTTQNDIDLFEYTTKLSKKANVVITSVLPLSVKKDGYFNELSYKISMRGRFGNIGKLFAEFENGGIPVVLSRVEIKRSEQSKTDLNAAVELKAYIYTDERRN